MVVEADLVGRRESRKKGRGDMVRLKLASHGARSMMAKSGVKIRLKDYLFPEWYGKARGMHWIGGG